MRLPMEIVEEIYCYLPFEKVIELSKYATKKLYNPEVHTLYWAINNDYLEAFKWLYENSDNEYHKHDCVDYAAWRGNLDITKWLINNDESLLERV